MYSSAQTDEGYAYDDNGNRRSYVTAPGSRLLCDGTFRHTYDDTNQLIGASYVGDW